MTDWKKCLPTQEVDGPGSNARKLNYAYEFLSLSNYLISTDPDTAKVDKPDAISPDLRKHHKIGLPPTVITISSIFGFGNLHPKVFLFSLLPSPPTASI